MEAKQSHADQQASSPPGPSTPMPDLPADDSHSSRVKGGAGVSEIHFTKPVDKGTNQSFSSQ